MPSGPSAASSAIPATAGGSTRGSSTSVITTERPGKDRVASRYAAGVPTATMMAIAIAVVSRLSRSASVAVGSLRLLISCPGAVWVKIATTGNTRNASVTAERSPEQQREPRAADHFAGGGRNPARERSV